MSAIRRSIAAGILATAPMLGASAQAPCSAEQYNIDKKSGGNAVERIHPVVSRPRYVQFVEAGKWVEAMGTVGEDAAEAFHAAGVPAADSAKFLVQVDEVMSALKALPDDSTRRAAYLNTTVRSERFNPKRGADRKYYVFTGASKIDVEPPYPTAQAEAVCWAAMSADNILFRLNLPLEDAAIRRLSAINTSWTNYRTYGYSRQPIELFLQRGSLRDTVPPHAQLILAHVSAGGEITTWGGRLDSLSANQTLVFEVIGGIGYWRDFTRYAGASAIVAMSSNRPAGAGVLVHLGPGMRGGAVFRKENGRTTTSALMSFDLYGLFDRSKKSVDDAHSAARSLVLLPGRPQ